MQFRRIYKHFFKISIVFRGYVFVYFQWNILYIILNIIKVWFTISDDENNVSLILLIINLQYE